MALIPIEEFSDLDISRIYIAGSAKEADMVEQLLTKNGISYAIEIESYIHIGIMPSSEHSGVSFYVQSGQSQFCKVLLQENGLSSGF